MKHMAMIKNNTVMNIALWDGISDWTPGNDYTLVDVTNTFCNIGWIYDPVEGTFTNPNPPAEPEPEV